jgi:ATP-dependent RNA circularization protein (DNA/RNA ligase family)
MAGNGAAVLALASIVGNTHHPDAALTALTVPLATFALGMGAGLTATQVMTSAFEDAGEMADEDRRASEIGAALIREMISDIENASRLTRDYTSRLKSNQNRYINVQRSLDKMTRSLQFANNMNLASVICVVLGMFSLIAGHALGLVILQPPG